MSYSTLTDRNDILLHAYKIDNVRQVNEQILTAAC